jgi:predicted ATPase
MQAAAPGQILADESVWRAAIEQFQVIPQPPLTLKGIAQPVRAYAVTGERAPRRAQLLQPNYPLPLVGRQTELMVISAKLALTLAGQSQIVALIGEAGIGKSRLLAEAIRLAQRRDFTGYGGACQSDGRDIAYQPWRPVWRGLFGLEEGWPPGEQVARLTAVMQERLPHRLNDLPLLGRLLDLPIPENEFAIQLTPQYRQSVLRAMLEEFLQQAAQQTPLLIVLEDLHWLDPLSHDLLEALAQATAAYPVCFLLAYRPPDQPRLQAPRLEKRENFTPLLLTELSWAEAAQLARTKLAQLYPDGGGALYTALIDDLLTRAQGNPFFLEELLNYLRDQDIKPGDMSDGRRLELPNSLHTLILSRIDQLPARQKMTMRAASVIGRRFPVKWLNGYYPELGDLAQLQADLAQLDALDLTLLETAEPEAAYLFKHVITQEVAYESLSFAARAELHERLAAFLEKTDIHISLDLLAYHYAQSENQVKQREYFQRAAQAAREAFANETALGFYDELLPLLQEEKERIDIHLRRGEVHQLLGNYEPAEREYRAALTLSQGNILLQANAQLALGKLSHVRDDYPAALDWFTQAQAGYTAVGDNAGLAQGLLETGWVFYDKGQYEQAQALLQAGLHLARQTDDHKSVALALNKLGALLVDLGECATARALHSESLNLSRQMGDKANVATSLNSLARVAYSQGEYAEMRPLLQEGLSLRREMGDKAAVTMLLFNSGLMDLAVGDYAGAQGLYEESLTLAQEIGLKGSAAFALNGLGNVAYFQGEYAKARALQQESLQMCQEIEAKAFMAYALLGLGLAEMALHNPDALEHIRHSLRLHIEMGYLVGQVSSLVAVAGLAWQAGEATGAAQWLGTADSALKTQGAAMDVEVKQLYAETLAAVRAQLGEAAFQAAFAVGAGWRLAESVQRVLGETIKDE